MVSDSLPNSDCYSQSCPLSLWPMLAPRGPLSTFQGREIRAQLFKKNVLIGQSLGKTFGDDKIQNEDFCYPSSAEVKT